jgi:biotin operon repressor
MIHQALIQQIQQRFSHEKRAKVCLWFDPQGEFERLRPALAKHVEQMKKPPFQLLAYDPKLKHGQLWLRRQVRNALKGLSAEKAKEVRFLIYLPLAEERLDSPDDAGRHYLELLTEYKIAGVRWLVGGKRATLFNFLKTAGVCLPETPGDQRQLVEGGGDSLLAKYAAKFHDKPPVFWEQRLTPELAQSRLVGDVDQMILDLAVQPEATWKALGERGVREEFLAAVKDRYDFASETDSPELWITALVEVLALTETYNGYGEPADFPFLNRLPPSRFREGQVQLLRRWLRDANSRPAWDRWIKSVEQHLNLTDWARGRTGLSFGFPHLARLRWSRFRERFAAASEKWSDLRQLVKTEESALREEVDFGRASQAPTGQWEMLLGVAGFVDTCEQGRKAVEKAASASELAKVYCEFAGTIDRAHAQLKATAEEHDVPEVVAVVDRGYGDYANDLNQRFFDAYTTNDNLELAGFPLVTDQLEAKVWSAGGRRAVIIVDALRYDCALALVDRLPGQEVRVEPVRAMLPTVTPIGMSALLPKALTPTSLIIEKNVLHPEVNGVDTSVRQNRLDLLTNFGATCLDIDEVEAAAAAPDKIPNLLVVFGHEEVDKLGHANAEALVRHLDKELDRIVRVVKRLHQWGYAEVNVVTDHGFVLVDAAQLPPEVPIKKEWCVAFKERFALVPASADVPLKTKPFSWDASVRVAFPPGTAFFKTEKAFSHGGGTLQEMIIPRLVSRGRIQMRKIGVEVVLPTYELTQAAVKLVLRPTTGGDALVGELALFADQPRELQLEVLRAGDGSSVLSGKWKTVKLEPGGVEVALTLFFDSKHSFKTGDLLQLQIRDPETEEQFPPGGIHLRIARDL